MIDSAVEIEYHLAKDHLPKQDGELYLLEDYHGI